MVTTTLRRARTRLASLAAALACLALASGPARADDSLQRVVTSGTLTVAMVPNAPWAQKGTDGQWRGYDIDVVTKLAADLGVKPRFVEATIDQVPQQLAGSADVAAGGLMIRPDLARAIVYSDPIGLSVVRTVATQASGPTPRFDKAMRVAVPRGSAAEQVAREIYGQATILPFATNHDAVSALLHGGADALVASSPVPRLVASSFDSHTRLVGPPLAKTAEALALRPDDTRLQAYVNNWIAGKLADGWLQHLRNHWFVTFAWVEDAPGKARAGTVR